MALVTGHVRQQDFLRDSTTGHRARLKLSELTWRAAERPTQEIEGDAHGAEKMDTTTTGTGTPIDADGGSTLRRNAVRHSTQDSDAHLCSRRRTKKTTFAALRAKPVPHGCSCFDLISMKAASRREMTTKTKDVVPRSPATTRQDLALAVASFWQLAGICAL